MHSIRIGEAGLVMSICKPFLAAAHGVIGSVATSGAACAYPSTGPRCTCGDATEDRDCKTRCTRELREEDEIGSVCTMYVLLRRRSEADKTERGATKSASELTEQERQSNDPAEVNQSSDACSRHTANGFISSATRLGLSQSPPVFIYLLVLGKRGII